MISLFSIEINPCFCMADSSRKGWPGLRRAGAQAVPLIQKDCPAVRAEALLKVEQDFSPAGADGGQLDFRCQKDHFVVTERKIGKQHLGLCSQQGGKLLFRDKDNFRGGAAHKHCRHALVGIDIADAKGVASAKRGDSELSTVRGRGKDVYGPRGDKTDAGRFANAVFDRLAVFVGNRNAVDFAWPYLRKQGIALKSKRGYRVSFHNLQGKSSFPAACMC
jgi:hypothetical protein